MWRFILSVFIFAVLIRNSPAISEGICEIAQDLARQFHIATSSDSAKIGDRYGEYGRKLSGDYKKYRQDKFLQKISEGSLAKMFSGLQNAALNLGAKKKEAVVNYVNLDAISSPYGIHGNNYSLYDINSPSGQFPKP